MGYGGSAFGKLPRAALVYGLGDLLPKAAYFLLLPWYLRHLGPGEFGTLTLATTLSTLVSFVLQWNLNGSVFRFYADQVDEKSRRRFAGSLLAYQAGWALLVTGVLFFFVAALGPRIFPSRAALPYVQLALVLALLSSAQTLVLAVLQMRQEAVLYRFLTFTSFALSTSLIAYLVVWRERGAYGFLLGQALAALAVLGPLAWVAAHRAVPAFSIPVIRRCLIFSTPLVVYTLFGWVMDWSNRYLLERFLGVVEVGRYSLGFQFALVLQAILNAFALAWVPVFYAVARQANALARLERFGRLYWAATLLTSLLIIVAARSLVSFVGGPGFEGAYGVVPTLVATQALTCLWHLVVNPLFLKERTGVLPAVMVVAAAISVGLNLLFIPRWGIRGAAVAVLIANLVLVSSAGVLSLRVFPVPYDRARMLGAALAAGVCLAAATLLPWPDTVLGMAGRFAAVSTFPAILLLLGIVRRSEVALVWHTIRRSESVAGGHGEGE